MAGGGGGVYNGLGWGGCKGAEGLRGERWREEHADWVSIDPHPAGVGKRRNGRSEQQHSLFMQMKPGVTAATRSESPTGNGHESHRPTNWCHQR